MEKYKNAKENTEIFSEMEKGASVVS